MMQPLATKATAQATATGQRGRAVPSPKPRRATSSAAAGRLFSEALDSRGGPAGSVGRLRDKSVLLQVAAGEHLCDSSPCCAAEEARAQTPRRRNAEKSKRRNADSRNADPPEADETSRSEIRRRRTEMSNRR